MLEDIDWVDVLQLNTGDRKLIKVEEVIKKLKKQKPKLIRMYHSVYGRTSFVWLSTDKISLQIAAYPNRFDGEWYWKHFLERNGLTPISTSKNSPTSAVTYSLEYTDI